MTLEESVKLNLGELMLQSLKFDIEIVELRKKVEDLESENARLRATQNNEPERHSDSTD